MKLSIVVPVYNEEANLRPLYERLHAVASKEAEAFEIVFVNDGSKDRSLAIMQELCEQHAHVKYISLSRNFGHEVASTAGLDAVDGDAVVLIDADLQDPPELIGQLIERWKAGAKIVYARRTSRDGETLFKKTTSFLFYRLFGAMVDVEIPKDTGDFRLMDRQVVEAIKQCRENPRFIRGLVAWVGFTQDCVYYERAARQSGVTKYNVIRLIELSWEAICGFSIIPLRFVMWLGYLVTLVSMILVVIVATQKIFFGIPIPGYAFQTCGMFFLGGVNFILLGVMARYLGYVYQGVQRRPLYFVEQSGGWERSDGG